MMVILIGLRGSGKTTVGRALAARLGVSFCDLDDVTVRAMGASSVAEAWRAQGERGFREAEGRALAEALSTRSQKRSFSRALRIGAKKRMGKVRD